MVNVIILKNNDELILPDYHYIKLIDCLVSSYNFVKLYDNDLTNKSLNDVNKFFINRYNKIPDNVFIFSDLFIIGNINLPVTIKINVIIADLHHYTEHAKELRTMWINKVSRIFSFYGYTFLKYFDTKIPIYFFPIYKIFDIKFNDNPINKILVSGRLNDIIYPFRQLMYEKTKKNKFIEYFPVNFSYRINKKDFENNKYVIGEEYIQKLNGYFACFTCDANKNHPYILAKHFEILSSGSLLLAGNPNTKQYFEKLGFKDNIHYISATPENIDDKVKFIMNFDNINLINEIRKNGYNLINEKHTFMHRAKFIVNVISNKANVILCTDGIDNTKYLMENFKNSL